MPMRCLVVTSDRTIRKNFYQVLEPLTVLTMYCENLQDEVKSNILSYRPNLIFIECVDREDENYRTTYELVKKLRRRTVFVPIITNPTRELLRDVVQQVLTIDALTPNADKDRILFAVQKAAVVLSHSIRERMDHYNGIFYFAGVQPTLKIRKAFSDANLGLLQYPSIDRLMNFMAANPSTQIVGICLNSDEELTNEQIASLGYDPAQEPISWEIAMYEAQENYLSYWDEAIRAQLMVRMLPTIVQVTTDSLSVIHPQVQSEVLERLGSEQRGESYLETMEKAGFAPPTSGDEPPVFSSVFDMIEELGVRMAEVDKQLPNLTRSERYSK